MRVLKKRGPRPPNLRIASLLHLPGQLREPRLRCRVQVPRRVTRGALSVQRISRATAMPQQWRKDRRRRALQWQR